MKTKTKLKATSDPREYKLLKREEDLSCSRCKPHGGENSGRKSVHGHRKPKNKDKR